MRIHAERLTLVHASPADLSRAPMPNASDEELQNIYTPLGHKFWSTGTFIARIFAACLA